MKISTAFAQIALSLCLVLPVSASFKLVMGDELRVPPLDFNGLIQEITLVERDVDVTLDYFVNIFNDPTEPRNEELIHHNFGLLHPDEIKELLNMTQKVREASMTVKALLVDPGADNAPVDDVGYTSEDGAKSPIIPALSFNRQNKTISFYPSFYNPERIAAHRTALVIAAAFKTVCGLQDTFMKTGEFGRWQPVGRHRIFGQDKKAFIDTLTYEGFEELGRKAYYATIHDAEALKWLALEFRGISRSGASQNVDSKVNST